MMTLQEMLKASLNYSYTWNRDVGDGAPRGKLDQIKVDKDEGYEVEDFIARVMKKHALTKISDARRIEDALQSCPSQYRDELIKEVEYKLDL